MNAAARIAVLDGLRVLAATDGLGRYTAFVRSVSQRLELTSGQASVCRKILVEHTGQLPPDLLASAMSDEPDEPGLPAPVFRRARGRPRLGAELLSPAERTRRRRAAVRLVAVELSADVVERLRRVRDAHGMTMSALIEAALNALESREQG